MEAIEGIVPLKQETPEHQKTLSCSSKIQSLSSDSGSGSGSRDDGNKRTSSLVGLVPINENSNKRPKVETLGDHSDDLIDEGISGDDGVIVENSTTLCNDVVLPVGFHDPSSSLSTSLVPVVRRCKQFWKAGDYEPDDVRALHPNSSYSAGMDHARVHPKFLHSNATSHKWALGAFAELLDNALDEVCNGATYVNVDVLLNMKDGNRMLLVQDNGGGMNPDKMRQCMSLGYSEKSKLANTIGQYGNGFKTSTMRLGADVIVFSCCQGKNGICQTRSIGMLSYTFLRGTGKEDIVVPMVDYEKRGDVWTRMPRSSLDDWLMNLDTIIHWSPYSSEQELLQQFDFIDNQGTRIIIYNLWEDDDGQLELDFDTDPKDIQLQGVNRDEKKIAMARQYPNSKHFLTYQHSLRSYASILYLRLPAGFRIILRGENVKHHNLVNDMMSTKKQAYKPQLINDETGKEPEPITENLEAIVTLGFVKDAKDHIDIQGFNVYHKNRLIKPFWRVWNAAGSDGRGVVGVLEANFVEPAHDKQGFERTTLLSRLEARLVQYQKNYWRDNCHEVGYAPRRQMNRSGSSTKVSPLPNKSRSFKENITTNFEESIKELPRRRAAQKPDQGSPYVDYSSEDEMTSNHLESTPKRIGNHSTIKAPPPVSHSTIKAQNMDNNLHTPLELGANVLKLRKENLELKKRLQDTSGSRVEDLLRDLQFEKDRCKSLEAQLEVAEKKVADMDKEQEALIQIFAEERDRRETEEANLRNRLQEASRTIQELLDKVQALEKMKIKVPSCKSERD